MPLKVEFDDATAIQVADFFEREGKLTLAAQIWQSLCASAPYRRDWREKLAGLLYRVLVPTTPAGSRERARALLDVASQSFPLDALRQEYLASLGQFLAQSRTRRERPGTIALCVSTGRSGSTSLADALAKLDNVCATHENPPTIDWQPAAEQVRFHFDRLRLLSNYYALVFDASHWWLNVVEMFLTDFPEGRIVGLVRETEACIRSFLRVKGSGPGSINHWAPTPNPIWASTLGDPSYPTYPIDERELARPDSAKQAAIDRYVREFNACLAELSQAHPERILMLETETLSRPATVEKLGNFLGIGLSVAPERLNVGTTADSEANPFRL